MPIANERAIAGRAEFGDPARTDEWHPHLSIGWLGDREDERGIFRMGYPDIGTITGRQATEDGLTVDGANATCALHLKRSDLVAFDVRMTAGQVARYRVESEIRIPYDVTGARGLLWARQEPLSNPVDIGGGIVEGRDIRRGMTVRRLQSMDGGFAVYHQTLANDRKDGFGGLVPAGSGKICDVHLPNVTDEATGEQEWGALDFDGSQLTIVFSTLWFARHSGPFVFDPDLGYTSVGATDFSAGARRSASSATASEDGTAESVSFYNNDTSAGIDGTGAIWGDNSGVPLTMLRDGAGTTGLPTLDWFTDTLDSTLALTNGTKYWIGQETGGDFDYAYDIVGGWDSMYWDAVTHTFGTCSNFADPPANSTAELRLSAYITYIAAGGANPKGPLGHPFAGPFGGPI